jgi:NAD(P)-dependent dehydrogenase (short-subunit alcohol dehydrogenase family)
MMKDWYRDKVVFITGASSGIGQALVKSAYGEGAKVVAVARSKQRLDETIQSLEAGERVVALSTDVGDRTQVQNALAQTKEQFGRIDVAISCAAVEYLGPIEAITPEELQSMINTNFYGLFNIVQLVLPIMQQQEGNGTIVNVSSPMARFAFSWSSAYAATKAANDAFILGLRHELADSGIRFVTVYPGPTKTRSGTYLPPDRLPAWHKHGQKMEADLCAHQLLEAVAAGRPVNVLASNIRMLMLMQRFMPALAERILSGIKA